MDNCLKEAVDPRRLACGRLEVDTTLSTLLVPQ